MSGPSAPAPYGLVRPIVASILVGLAMFALVARLYYLQVVRGDEFTVKSESNFVQLRRVVHDRGIILDRSGRILVDNRPAYDVFLTPAFIPDSARTLARITDALELDRDLAKRLDRALAGAQKRSEPRPIEVASGVRPDEGAALAQASEVRITTPLGTDIRGQVKGRPVQYETGLFRKPGQFAAFPDSEINISPIEGTAEGKIVSDVSIMSVGVTIYDHVTLIVKGGKVADIQGGMAAVKLRAILAALNDEKAYNYAEFGIGLNPKARLAATNLEDLGRLGNCHAGIGSNFAIGGKILAPNHIDAMYRDATISFDGKVVLDNGICKI